MPTSTVEDYLKSVLLEEQRRPDALVSTGRIAEMLEVAPGTVTAMIKTLAESGLVEYEPYSGVRLTSAGRQLATHVVRRHRLVELFLVEVLGMGWGEVHDEAERLEHAVSDRIIERMDEMLGYPAVDPHGDPIPTAQGDVEEPKLDDLLSCPMDTPLRIARVRDQSTEFLRLAEEKGLTLGSLVTVRERSEATDTVDLELARGNGLSLGFRAAEKFLVESV